MTWAANVDARDAGGERSMGYLERSEQPLTSLLFLLPFIVLYEMGTRFFTTAAVHGQDQQIIAFTLMQRFFRLFGASGQHLPALAVVGILLAWHIARNDRWQLRWGTLFGMLIESVALAFPLIVLGLVMSHYFPLAAPRILQVHEPTTGYSRELYDQITLRMGAGVYEEMLFRLMLFSVLSLILKDLFQVSNGWVHLWVVAASALLFSAYHYLSPAEHFQWRTFTFRTLAGAYFGALFLARGFGITASSHAAYDIAILFL